MGQAEGVRRIGRRVNHTDWLLDPEVAYLNHGGYGALPVPVATAAARWRVEVEANPTDFLARRWPEEVDRVRNRLAVFLGADPADLVFTANATSGTATVLAAFPFQAGDEVVITDHRYPAVAEQTAALVATRGVDLRVAHVPLAASSAADVVTAVTTALTGRTRLLVVDHIASPTGLLFPVREIVAAAHAAGVPVLVDAAHAPGQVEVDLRDIDADFWVGNLHKWVCSQRACAVLQVAPAWQDRLRPLVPSDAFSGGFRGAFDWPGTLDPVPLLTIGDALDFWDGLGWDDVRRTQHALVRDGALAVADALGTEVAIADHLHAAMALVTLPVQLDADQAVELVRHLTREHRVTPQVVNHDGATYVRLCGQVYNRPSDYERLAAALVQDLLEPAG